MINFKQINALNLDYLIVIDDTDCYIRFNFMFHAFEVYKTAIFHFKVDENISQDQFLSPIKAYTEKVNEDNKNEQQNK